MDNNRKVGLLLMGILLMVNFFFVNKRQAKKLKEKEQQEAALKAEEEQNKKDETTVNYTDGTSSTTEPGTITSPKTESKPAVAEQTAVLENDQLKLVLSSKGGRIVEAILKDYESYQSHYSENEVKEPVKLYTADHSAFNWQTESGNTKNIDFTITKGDDFVEFTNGTITQRYSLAKDNNYLVNYSANLGGDDAELSWDTNFVLQEKDMRSDREFTFFAYQGEKGKLKKFKKPKENVSKSLESPAKYIVQRQRFFNQTIIAEQPIFQNAQLKMSYDRKDETDNIKLLETETEVKLDNGKTNFQILISPNDRKVLKSVDKSLANIQPKGIFGLTKALSWLFDKFRPFFSNYGLLILMMTILIKLLLTPLTYRSYLSQAKMSVLKPEVAELNEKYKDDPAKKQSEQMKLYNKAGVNPLGGCVPSLLQIPIFFSLYYFFRSSIFFRQKPFLWANDLSTYDELIKLPFKLPMLGDHISIFAVLYGIALFFSMRMTNAMGGGMPTAPSGGGNGKGGDMQKMMQSQMKIMQFAMPVFLPVIFNSFPVALTFYYFCYNIINGLQTLILKKFVINEDKIHAQIQENKKKEPKKQSKFRQRLDDMMKQQAEFQKQQEAAKNKGKKK